MQVRSQVTILGCRGSVPVSGKQFRKYGGATTCFAVRLGGQLVIVDAGTGLLRLGEVLQGEKTVPLLLTHGHLDHLLGLPMCPQVFSADTEFRIFGDRPDALRALMAPPLWPVSPEELPARIRFSDLPAQFSLGPVEVQSLSGRHPGGVKLLRLGCGGVSVTVMTDCTPDPAAPALREFAENTDLLLIDGQYAPEEWTSRTGFGHGTWEAAARFGADCGAKRIRIVHHDPERTDAALDAALLPDCSGCEIRFGYEGEVILL